MINISLQTIANQSLNIVLDGNNYTIRLHACREIMAVDIIRNNIVIVSGMRAVAGTPLLPYSYLEDGNFIFVTQNDEYPNWPYFGINQFLIYASQAELDG